MPCRLTFTFLMLMAINCGIPKASLPSTGRFPLKPPPPCVEHDRRPRWAVACRGPGAGPGPARLSFRTGQWTSVDASRRRPEAGCWECMAPVDLGGVPTVRVEWQGEYDGLHVERLSWQLPCGPRTEAVFLKPANAQGRLPAILGLHDRHGQEMGWRKIARVDDKSLGSPGETAEGVLRRPALGQRDRQAGIRGPRSRHVPLRQPPRARGRARGTFPTRVIPSPPIEGVAAYNVFAGDHEHIMEKSLVSAGPPGRACTWCEDLRALDVLCAPGGRGCLAGGLRGLSGGGMRTVFLGGLDDRIQFRWPGVHDHLARFPPRQVLHAHLDDVRAAPAPRPGLSRNPGLRARRPRWS